VKPAALLLVTAGAPVTTGVGAEVLVAETAVAGVIVAESVTVASVPPLRLIVTVIW
jgi:hypothetical protein